MCGPTGTKSVSEPKHISPTSSEAISRKNAEPTLLARYTCVSVLVGIFALWGKLAFVEEDKIPGASDVELHDWKFPAAMGASYLVSLPLVRWFSNKFLLPHFDVKLLLREAMILYNAAQVVINGWMVYRFIHAVLFRGHPAIGGAVDLIDTGATYAIWVHYCDKYLEFLDTYFMVLRGRMDQVSFLHVYHHTSISFAWWFGIKLHPGGDGYFGALLNSWIHVMMYSYYTFSLLKLPCPWKKYLTQAQLVQFTTVLLYSFASMRLMPDDTSWGPYAAHLIQDFEMTSLFFLFLHFYRKAYSQKKRDNAALRKKDLVSTDSDGALEGTVEQSSISSADTDEHESS